MHGVVYTRKWVARLMLDMVGYTADADLLGGVAIEPSCGCGASVEEMAARLADCARREGRFSADDMRACICAFDVDAAAVATTRALVSKVLQRAGMPEQEAGASLPHGFASGTRCSPIGHKQIGSSEIRLTSAPTASTRRSGPSRCAASAASQWARTSMSASTTRASPR